MGANHIIVGLGTCALKNVRDVSANIANSRYFNISVWASEEENVHAIWLKNFDFGSYFHPLGPAAMGWYRGNCSSFLKNYENYLSRTDVRVVYEWRHRAALHNKKSDEIYEKELCDIADNDQIHLLIPSGDSVASAIAFFVGWDIKAHYKKYGKQPAVIAHLILPDTILYCGLTKAERAHAYCNSGAFIKELICIAEICNGGFVEDIRFDYAGFTLSDWLDGQRDYGCIEKLPFDGVTLVGSKEPAEIFDCRQPSQSVCALTDEIVFCIHHPKECILRCDSKHFRRDLYQKCPMFSDAGYVTKAYKSYQNKPHDEFLHLDWRWDELLRNM